MREKNDLVGRICVLSDRNKRLLAKVEVFCYLSEKLPLSQNSCTSAEGARRFSQCLMLSLPSQFLS